MPTPFSTDPLVQQPSRLHAAVARSFSYLINVTQEEALFAIFGHWGREKSFIARTIGKDCSSTHKTVFFSSWRYPHAPECWAFLYETLLEEIKKAGALQLVRTVLRRNIMRSGIWPAIFADVSMFLVILGLLDRLVLYGDALWSAISILGLSVVFLSAKLWFGGRKIALKLRDTYASIASHRDKLGIQEALGDDIRLLITAWLGGNAKELNSVLIRLLVIIIALSAALPLSYLLIIHQTIPAWLSSIPDWCRTAPAIAWFVWNALVVVLALIAMQWQQAMRILLVLEDLDRCPPGAALHVIESVSLLLEPTLTSGSIQAMALIDEAVLDDEIAGKFSSKRGQNAVHAHKEKLFTAYVRLPRLDKDDFAGLAAIFLMKTDYDAAVGNLAKLKDEIAKLTLLMNLTKSTLSALANEKNPPPRFRQETREVRRSIPMKFSRGMADVDTTVTESVPVLHPYSQEEIKKWQIDQDQSIHAMQVTLAEEQGKHDSLEKALKEAERHVEKLQKEIHAEVAKVDKSEQQRDATAYLNSLETTPAEREFLRDQINELLNMRDYEWGPRSAHVASKKYLLFKTLWFQAELATGPKDLTDAERLELVEAFFLTMKESLDKQIRMALDEESRVEQMRKLAEYVV